MKPKNCPKCNSNSIASILYGLPAFDDKMQQDIDTGKLVLGGCCIDESSPEWHCNKCEHEWGSIEI